MPARFKHNIFNLEDYLSPSRIAISPGRPPELCTNSLHNLRDEYESHAASFEPWSCFHERSKRRGMRMADCDGKSVTRGIACGKINLRENRVAICRIVEKHLRDAERTPARSAAS